MNAKMNSWDDKPVDVSTEVNFIWSVATLLHSVSYKDADHRDVILPMTVLRRLECALAPTKEKVAKYAEEHPNAPEAVLKNKAGMEFFNKSPWTLEKLLSVKSQVRDISAVWESYVFFDEEMIQLKDFLERFVAAVQHSVEGVDELRTKWSTEESRKEFLEAIADAGFTEDILKDVQKYSQLQEYDMFDVMLDLAYNVEPVTRAMRVERLTAALEAMSEPRRRFAEIVLSNYVIDGVWKLNRATFTDVLNQLYHGNMPAALADLGFAKPADALGFFSNIQQQLYAA